MTLSSLVLEFFFWIDSLSEINGFFVLRDVRPDLFSVLAQQLQSADVLASHRILMILFRTLKELSTKRLTADQRTFAEVCLLLCLHPLDQFIFSYCVYCRIKAWIFALVKDKVQFILLADLVATLRL